MQTITFTCETITPMFLAGADGTTPELRAPSIKGALRFWWRAMNGHLELAALKKQEVELFGGSYKNEEGKEVALRSKVIIRVACDAFTPSTKMPTYVKSTYDGKYKNINMLYYAAYGHTEYVKGKGTVMVHSFIPVNTKFKVIFSSGNENELSEFVKIFKITSLYGGLGSKSRNGFGCFTILNAKDKENRDFVLPGIVPTSLLSGTKQGYSTFSTNAEIFEVIDGEGIGTWEKALGFVTWCYEYAREIIEKHHTHKNRLYVAQPIVVQRETIPNFLDRHAKPFFINIRKDAATGKYYARVLFLPYNYLEDNQLKDDRGNAKFTPTQITAHQTNYNKAITDFKKLFLECKDDDGNPCFKKSNNPK